MDGNLEITWIRNDTYDLSFLENIHEVTGYVLISHVDVIQLRLLRLQIIRGRTLFQYEYLEKDYGLFVAFSNIKLLELPALREVIHGCVGMVNSYDLCYIQTIDWEEIISGKENLFLKFKIINSFLKDSNAMNVLKIPLINDNCELNVCDSTCEMGCWGSGPEN